MSSALQTTTIRPPELRSASGSEVVKFKTAYKRYVAHVEQANATLPTDRKVKPITRKACFQADFLESLVMLGELKGAKKIEEVKEPMITKWLDERGRCSNECTPSHLKNALDNVTFVVDNADPNGAVTNFFLSICTELRCNRIQHLLEESPKCLIEMLVPKLQPSALREEMKSTISLWNEEQQKDLGLFREETTRVATEIARYDKTSKTGAEKRKRGDEKGESEVEEKGKRMRHGQEERKNQRGKQRKPKRDPKDWTEPCLHPDCDERHPLRMCKKSMTKEYRKKLLDEYFQSKKDGNKAKMRRLRSDTATYNVTFPGAVVSPAMGDCGSDHTAIPMELFKRIQATGAKVTYEKFPSPVRLEAAFELPDEVKFTASGYTKLDIRIDLPCGQLSIRNVVCWVIDQAMREALLGRPLLKTLGMDLDSVLEKLCSENAEIDAEEYDSGETPTDSNKLAAVYGGIRYDARESDPISPADEATANMGTDSSEEIAEAIDKTIEKARKEGISDKGATEATKILNDHRDTLRIKLGSDPPAKLEPYKIELKSNARPVRCTQRKYHPKQAAFINSTIRCLEKIGAVVRNPNARWASPALAVPKPGTEDGLRFTVDSRPVNQQTIPIASAMPELESALRSTAGSLFFANIDMCHAYWQLLMHLLSREIMSIQTPIGVFTPTRILQGTTDSANHFQAVTSLAFSELQENMIQWLDDFLIHAKSEEELLAKVRRFFEICADKGLKVHARKITIFTKSVDFCGRTIDANGIRYNPRNLKALESMLRPTTAAELQQFICAANWMRPAIPNFAATLAPLHTLMEACFAQKGKRTKRSMRGVPLSGLWGEAHDAAFADIKKHIAHSTRLAHLREGHQTCLYTDASEHHWAAVFTQIPYGQMGWDTDKQHHEPLLFMSGKFTGQSERWSIAEKEGFAVVEAMTKAEYISGAREVHIFTDHANLVYIFNPFGLNPGISRHVAHKLMRWAMRLSAFRYVIEFVPGDRNVWADILSRWGSAPTTTTRTKIAALYAPVRSHSGEVDWPKRKDIRASQRKAPKPAGKTKQDGLWCDNDGRVWIPETDQQLKLRILIAAHCGMEGHRRMVSTKRLVHEHFTWKKMDLDVQSFCNSCIHCAVSDSGERIPRPLGHALHAQRPNEIVHFDFCHMGTATSDDSYVLILKDDLSSYCWMFPCERADAEAVADSLLDWMVAFGRCERFISDQGTHFKNDVIKLVCTRMHIAHHFTHPYCPWSNGTVEVVCRELIRTTKALLSEFGLPWTRWPVVLPLVQSALNNHKLARLGKKAPITVFAGLPSNTALGLIKLREGESVTLVKPDDVSAYQSMEIEKLANALGEMHKVAAEQSTRARDVKVSDHNQRTGVKACNFETGDYVLRARVQKHIKKLTVRWTGPMRVRRCLSDFLFELEDLTTGKLLVVHGSRVRFFRNSDFEVTQEVKDYLQFQQGQTAAVDELLDMREHRGVLELLVVYRGFQDEDPAWVDLTQLHEDVPVLVQDFLKYTEANGTSVKRDLADKASSILLQPDAASC